MPRRELPHDYGHSYEDEWNNVALRGLRRFVGECALAILTVSAVIKTGVDIEHGELSTYGYLSLGEIALAAKYLRSSLTNSKSK